MNIETHQPFFKDRLFDSLDYFLIEISGKIQLTKTQREKAEGHYQAVANVLRESPEGTLLNEIDIQMKAFGGLGTNTAVYPFQKDEYDLDLIVQFKATTSRFKSAQHLYSTVFDRLNGLDTYKDRIEPKPRCIRIYYSGEFYLDVMPAVLVLPYETENPKLYIAEEQDDGSYEYVLVDPLGLMNWFEQKCKLERQTFANARLDERADFEVMPLTSDEAKKPKLKQANQLIKRARDSYFAKDDDSKKILKSVLLLTVSGNCYNGETGLYALVTKILNNLDAQTENLFAARVENPTNPDEDFLKSLRENPDRYKKLRKFIADFKSQWAKLADQNLDITSRANLLKKLFGETVTQQVFEDYGNRMDSANRSGNVRMLGSGTLGLSASIGSKVPRHQFFGDK